MKLSKEQALFQRNEKGELLPIEVELKGFGYEGQTVKVRPCTIGSWNDYRSKTDESGNVSSETDCQFIVDNLIDPSFSLEETKNLKTALIKVLVMAVLRTTGLMPTDEVREKK